MKRIIETIKNIYQIEELRNRIITTLGLILIYRLGSYVVLPGIDSNLLAAENQNSSSGLAGLIDIFAGGAFSRASIFALGIMPYISASIVIQLLGMAIPYFQKMQKEGESGRRRMNQITRLLTIGVVALQAPGYIASYIPAYDSQGLMIRPDSFFWLFTSVVILITGTMFVMWIGERITERGIGNGISLLIMIGIIANLPFAFFAEFATRVNSGGLFILLIEIAFLLLVTIASILLVQGTRKIPIQFAKRIVGNRQYGGVISETPCFSTIDSRVSKLMGLYSTLLIFLNPNFGIRLCKGICPPSKPLLYLNPERDLSPLFPRVAVPPVPLACPRARRFFDFIEPFAGFKFVRSIILLLY